MKKLIILIFLAFHINSAVSKEDNWYSLARHGECVPFEFMNDIEDDIAGIKDLFSGVKNPDELREKYLKLGVKASLQDIVEFARLEIKKGKKIHEKIPPEKTWYFLNVDGETRWVLVKKINCKNGIIKS